MATTRRELLRTALGGTTLISSGSSIPAFLARSAEACVSGNRASNTGQILVVVQLTGGNDGLNTIVPYADDSYYSHRPTIGIPKKNLIRIDDHVGFHPSLKDFASMLDDGRLAIVQSVGYPNPNRSHFESMAIWHTARTDVDLKHPGWLARAMDTLPGRTTVDPPGMHIADETLPQALRGGRTHVPTIARGDEFRRRIGIEDTMAATDQRMQLDRIARESCNSADSLVQFIARSKVEACATSARFETVLRSSGGERATGEPGLGGNLRQIARLIRTGMETPIYYTSLDGFDTHAEQPAQHANLLSQVSLELKAFLDDLEKSGEADRVTILVFSEFGRRLQENASEGTDHGTAAPVFVLGSQVNSGLFGPRPNLADLDDLDPKFSIDFRRIYAGLLEGCLKLPPAEILGPGIEPMGLIRAT